MNNYTDIGQEYNGFIRQIDNIDTRQCTENKEQIHRTEIIYDIPASKMISNHNNEEFSKFEFVKIIEKTQLITKNKLYITTHIKNIKYIILENLPNNYKYSLYYNSVKIMDSIKSYFIGYEDSNIYLSDTSTIDKMFKQQFDFTLISNNDICKLIHDQKNQHIFLNSPWNLYIDVNNDDPSDNFHIYNHKTNKFLYDEYIIYVIDENFIKHKLILQPNNTYHINNDYNIHLAENIQFTEFVDVYINGKFICNNNIIDFSDDIYDEYVEKYKNDSVNKLFNNYTINKKWINLYNIFLYVVTKNNTNKCIVTHNNVKLQLYVNDKLDQECWRYKNLP